jgi:hypothetical protein
LRAVSAQEAVYENQYLSLIRPRANFFLEWFAGVDGGLGKDNTPPLSPKARISGTDSHVIKPKHCWLIVSRVRAKTLLQWGPLVAAPIASRIVRQPFCAKRAYI